MNSKQKRFMESYKKKLSRMILPELRDEWNKVRHALNPHCKERHQEEEESSDVGRLFLKPEDVPRCSECECCRTVLRPNATRYLYYCNHNNAIKHSPDHLKFGKTFICYGKTGGLKEPNLLNSPRWCPKKYEGKKGR